MTRPVPPPTLSDLLDHSAAEWSAQEIQRTARAALKMHAPDRQPLTWIKRFGLLPWLQRNPAECLECGEAYPCITHRYATQLLSAGRLPASRGVVSQDSTGAAAENPDQARRS